MERKEGCIENIEVSSRNNHDLAKHRMQTQKKKKDD